MPENLGSSNDGKIPWMDGFPDQSTIIPEIIEESNQIGTVVIFVISAILTITLLFVMAVFIDCRQQKLTKLQTARPKRKVLKLPRISRPVADDETGFADKMQENEPATSNVNIV